MKKATNRIKLSLPVLASREEAETLVGEIALITTNKTKTTSQMDAEIATVRQRYEANLAAYDADLKQKTDLLCAWAQSNPDEFPKNRKSIDFVQGTIGFRTGNPKLSLLGRAWNWEKVLGVLQILRWRKFIRIQREVDKEAILARAAAVKDSKAFAAKVLTRIGLKVVQDETFYVDPKLTKVETRQTVEAA